MVTVSAEAIMAVTMNVRPKRIRVHELTQRTAPDVNVSNATIKNAQGRTMGHKYCLWTQPGGQLSKIDSDIGVGLFKRAAHER